MSSYKITGPDGNAYTVSAPDDATQDQVLAYAQANYQHPQVDKGVSHASDPQTGLAAGQMPTATTTESSPTFSQRGYDVSASIIHNVADTVKGTAQLVGSGITAGADALLSPDNSVRQAIDQTNQNFKDNVKADEANYQKQIPNNAATYAGAAIGQTIPLALDAPAMALQKIGEVGAKLAPSFTGAVGAKIASGMAQAGAIGAVQPVTGDESYAAQKAKQIGLSAALGGVVPLAMAGARGINSLAQHVYAPQTIASNELGRTLEATPETLNALSNIKQFVPGETPTTAQVLGGTRPVMVEKAYGNTPAGKEALTNVANNNNAARVAVLKSLGGDDAALQAAKDTRTAATQPFIQANLQPGQNPVDATPVLQSLAKLQSSALGVKPTISKGATSLAADINSRLNPDGTIDAGILDAIRQNANSFIAQHAPNGVVGSQEQAALVPIKNQIQSTLNKAVPGYSDYLAAYAKHSQPINTMESANAILEPVSNGAFDTAGNTQLTLARVNAGLKKSDNAQYGLSPTAQQQIEGIRQSLQRESISNGIKSPGSDTAYNLQAQGMLARNLLGPSLQGPSGKLRVGTALAGMMMGDHVAGPTGGAVGLGIGALIDKGATAINSRIQNAYAAGLRDPAVAKQMITQFLNANQRQAPAILQKYPQWQALLSAQPAQIATRPQAMGATP